MNKIGKMIISDAEQLKEYEPGGRVWQGIPSFERTKKGRCFSVFYTGETGEMNGNYCTLAVSDDGENWRDPVIVTYAGKDRRCYDPNVWIDPLGRLWLIWSVMPDLAVYAAICDHPDADELVFGEERRIGTGVMLNKPTVLSSGEWMFPIAVWKESVISPYDAQKIKVPRLAFVVRTVDEGKTFTRLGGVDMPDRCFDEHMIVELKDGRLAMFVRTYYGIGVSYSFDGGFTWSDGKDTGILSPNSRFFVRKLSSGNVLLVTNDSRRREKMTAFVSTDDCKTWQGGLLLDKRDLVSYPDCVESDGCIYITYDCERGNPRTLEATQKEAREILYARFTEADALAGKNVSGKCDFKKIISKLGKYDGKKNPYSEKKYFTDDEYVDYLMTLPSADDVMKRLYSDGVTCYVIKDAARRERADVLFEMLEKTENADEKRKILFELTEIFKQNKREYAVTDETDLIEKIIAYIGEHYGEELNLDVIAKQFAISRYYLCHAFKRQTGTSVAKFITSRRIYMAKKMLKDSFATITDIGYECGFSDSAYFTKTFRRAEGISPGVYRSRMRKIAEEGSLSDK
ncbi:MAG: exo-alpha-sialidase [Firmicutes bacterium]|nr:exo-alpha-sialidase [Bacillota bacterium]MDY5531716.1 exo-alpha-sialidase [Pumilibacteraceae bacterium]